MSKQVRSTLAITTGGFTTALVFHYLLADSLPEAPATYFLLLLGSLLAAAGITALRSRRPPANATGGPDAGR